MTNKKLVTTALKLTSGGSKDPPTEILLWTVGDVVTDKGTFTLTADNMNQIYTDWKEWGNRQFFDYDHAQFLTAPGDPIRAGGWYDLEIRGNELWLVNIEWTDTAASMISAKELLYYSPAFEVNTDGEIISLLNTALTNFPATHGLKPLVASRGGMPQKAHDRRRVTAAMSFDDIASKLSKAIESAYGYYSWVVEVYDEYVVFRKDGSTYKATYTLSDDTVSLSTEAVEVKKVYDEIKGGTMLKTAIVTLNLAGNTDENTVLAHIASLKNANDAILQLTGKASLPEALAEISTWKAAADKLPEVQTLLANREAAEKKAAEDREKSEHAALIKAAKDSGELEPALVPFFEERTKADLEQYLATKRGKTKAEDTADRQLAGKDTGGADRPAAVVLTAHEREIAAHMGLNETEFAEYRAKKAQKA